MAETTLGMAAADLPKNDPVNTFCMDKDRNITHTIESLERRIKILESKMDSITYIIGASSGIIKDISTPFNEILEILSDCGYIADNIETLTECSDDTGMWE